MTTPPTDYKLRKTRHELTREVSDYITLIQMEQGIRVFVVADENTQSLLPEFPVDLVLGAGEEYKDLRSAHRIWLSMASRGICRNDLLLAIGGGTVTDICGFVAANYKRGCRLAFIPTTLLALIDASVGGKCGVDLPMQSSDQNIKNLLGTFYPPEVVFGCVELVREPRHLFQEGLAEAIKCYCLFSKDPTALFSGDADLYEMVRRCIEYKQSLVEQDPYDRSVRQYLNLGHTVGHALEGLALAEGRPISHGRAVAAGLVIEGYFSYVLEGFPQGHLLRLGEWVQSFIAPVHFSCDDYDRLWAHALQDKKNLTNPKGQVTCTLLKDFGAPLYGAGVGRKLWDEGLDFYKDLMRI